MDIASIGSSLKPVLGHGERHIELRVITVLELVKNSRKYASQAIYGKMCSHLTSVQYVFRDVSMGQFTCTGEFSQVDSE